MRPPAVSLILPTHNRPGLLDEALLSVGRQTYAGPIEIIVVDDASNPPVTAHSLQGRHSNPIRVVRNPSPQGGAAAKNRGVREATGDYLVFLDDDDLLSERYIEDAVNTLERFPAIKTLFMEVEWFGERADWGQTHHDRNVAVILQSTRHEHPLPELYLFTDGLFAALLQRIPMPFQRPVLRRADFEAIGYYQEDCLLWDCEWALRAALHGPCALLKRSPYLQRASGQGYSSQRSRHEEHILSATIAKERLLEHPAVQAHPRQWNRLTDALATAWFDAAYFYCQEHRYRQALRALGRSAHYRLRPRQVKLLGKIVFLSATQAFRRHRSW